MVFLATAGRGVGLGVGVVSAYAAPAPSARVVWRCGRRSVPGSPPLLCSVHAHPSHFYHLFQATPFPPLVLHIPYPLHLPSLPLWPPPCRRFIISPWFAIPFPRAPSIPCFHAMVLGSFMDLVSEPLVPRKPARAPCRCRRCSRPRRAALVSHPLPRCYPLLPRCGVACAVHYRPRLPHLACRLLGLSTTAAFLWSLPPHLPSYRSFVTCSVSLPCAHTYILIPNPFTLHSPFPGSRAPCF